jgi:SAM-dependent methyltransferase
MESNRQENLNRLFVLNTNKRDFYYLHYKSLFSSIENAVTKYAKGDVLDIGCGNKPYESYFEGRINKYIGCDVVQSNMNQVDLICYADNIPLPSNSFDTVISTQTIEHVANHQGLINEANRLLKEGGYFIVSGPFTWPLHEEPYDFFRFSKHGYRYILEKGSFEIVEINSNGGMWATSGQGLIHALVNIKSNKWLVKFIRFISLRLKFYILINSIFSLLDRIDYNEINTINYTVIARKK